MAFSRLVMAVDNWASTAYDEPIFAQTGVSSYVPKHMQSAPFITPQEFRRYAQQAKVIISHAGMGAILTALEFGKPIIVMPRRHDLGEHRSDHQIATAKYFGDQGRVTVAWDCQELQKLLARQWAKGGFEPISPVASPVLIATIREFISSTTSTPAASSPYTRVGRNDG
jgi:UDP-N-acetylglucosamine transferase subunit ALG13